MDAVRETDRTPQSRTVKDPAKHAHPTDTPAGQPSMLSDSQRNGHQFGMLQVVRDIQRKDLEHLRVIKEPWRQPDIVLAKRDIGVENAHESAGLPLWRVKDGAALGS